MLNFQHPLATRKPDWKWYQDNIGCRAACPLGTDARGCVIAVSEGRYMDAYRLARANNPFASTCGRICSAPCEDSCTRAHRDGAVTIRALERFVTELFGPESLNDPHLSLAFSAARGSDTPVKNGKPVAIVGAGPAGLSCAHDLARLGYECSIFERENHPGGQLACVPEWKLPQAHLQAEIDAILLLGIKLILGSEINPATLADELIGRGYVSVVVATGLSTNGESWQDYDTEGVFTCGNLVIGDKPFVYAIADGQRVACEVDRFLSQTATRRETTMAMSPIPIKMYSMPFNWDRYLRVDPLISPIIPETGYAVELSYEQRLAEEQGARCLRCHINPVLEGDRCNSCGKCVEICPEDALSLVACLDDSPSLMSIIEDPMRCTRCGLCARICPDEAISMQALEVVEDWRS